MGTGKRNKENDKTMQYKIQASKKTSKNKTNEKGKKKKKSRLKKMILIFIGVVLLLCLIAVGVFAGIFFSDKWALTKEELVANENTQVLDKNGKQIALLSATEGDGNRKVISLDEMGKYTANAYVAIEDKRFYEHSGVDVLRTAKATLSYLKNGTDSSNVGGGSTITQQLVKNLMNDDADTGTAGIERKIREMSRAYQLEKILTKDEILEKYLNVIFVGGIQLHGVEYGAQYYFAKSAKDLDLAESAFLAGINNAPNMYNPYGEEDNSELIKSRTKLVLNAMKDQGKISNDPEEAEKLYNEAIEKVEKGLKFKKGKIEFSTISYFVQEALGEAATDFATKKDISYKEAYSMIKSGGYKLYTTQDSNIQKIVINEMSKDKYVETKTYNGKKMSTQMGMTIIDFKTGKVVAMGGALGSDVGTNDNYATSTNRQTGSSIKPLANISTGLEEKVITASTLYYDNFTTFPSGSQKWEPKNAGGYQGLCTVRKAIEVSSNIVNAKIFTNIGAKTVIEYLHAFGLDTYTEEDDGSGSLAIGGVNHGSSTLQMAAAYASLANGGEYIEPTFYEKLVDNSGNTVLEPEQETRRVISEANAFIVTDILMDVVTGSQGTARECYMSNIDVAAKTGTTDYDDNTWLCGYTPYYAAATWNGYPDGAGKAAYSMYNVGNARSLWANVMKSVHKDLDSARFKKPDNVVTAKICRQSGKLATSKCSSTYTEYFVEGTVPKACDGHTTVKICKETGKVANEYCPEVEEKTYTGLPEKERNAPWTTRVSNNSKAPTEKCTKHTEETSKITVVNVVGKTEAEARTLLSGLDIQVVEGHDSTQADGIILRQSLSEGTKVDKGVSIVLTVNKIVNSGGTDKPSDGNSTDNGGGNTENPDNGGTEKPSGGNVANPGEGETNTPTTPPTPPTTPTTPTNTPTTKPTM